MTVPLVGGGSLTFAKRDLISFAKYEGDNAILLHNYKKPVKIRLTDEEFFDDYVSVSRGCEHFIGRINL